MLRISKKADYAVFLLGAIARQGAYPGGEAADTVVSAHEIAKQAGLNKSVVANLLKEYSRHGLLDSVRGLRGGYRLTTPPSEISLGQILEVVEGKFVLVDCVPHAVEFPAGDSKAGESKATATDETTAGSHDCSLIGFCPSKQPMRVVHQRISQLFADIHLDELCSMTPVADAPTAISNTAISTTAISTTAATK
ncbi:MAG: Rrf2 family protein [Planctomycetota bacterium]|jgi:Rrf2 family protein